MTTIPDHVGCEVVRLLAISGVCYAWPRDAHNPAVITVAKLLMNPPAPMTDPDEEAAKRVLMAWFREAAGETLNMPPISCDAVNPCSPEDVAAIELYSWQQSVMRALPDAQTAITATPDASSASNIYTITITWAQTGDHNAASFTLTVQT